MELIKLLFIIFIISNYGLSKDSQLRVGVFELAPFALKGEDVFGIHVDFIKEALDIAEVDYEISLLPYARLVQRVKEKQIDLALIFRRDDLTNNIELVKSIGFENLIVSHKDNPLITRNSLTGKKIGVIQDAKYENDFDKNNKIQKVNLQKYEQSFDMLSLKRIDGFVIPTIAYNYIFKNYEKNVFSPSLVLNTKYNYFYINKEVSKEIQDKIKSANNKLLKENYLKKIIKKYQLD